MKSHVLSMFPKGKRRKAIHVAMEHRVPNYAAFLSTIHSLVKERKLVDEGFEVFENGTYGLYKQYTRL